MYILLRMFRHSLINGSPPHTHTHTPPHTHTPTHTHTHTHTDDDILPTVHFTKHPAVLLKEVCQSLWQLLPGLELNIIYTLCFCIIIPHSLCCPQVIIWYNYWLWSTILMCMKFLIPCWEIPLHNWLLWGIPSFNLQATPLFELAPWTTKN